MENKFTSAQKRAIESDSQKILVSASAGSGKTTVMIQRIIRLLLGGADLGGMAVCTFTKSAAADMRLKLYKELSALSHSGNETAKQQLKKLPSAEISTLHSLCGRIIRNFFYRLEIDPAFEIADEMTARGYLEKCIEEVIAEGFTDLGADFTYLYNALLVNRKDSKIRKMIKSLYDFSISQEDFDVFLNKIKLVDSLDAVYNYLEVLKELVKRTRQKYTELKQKKALMDYADLEHYACEILKDESVLSEVNERYQYLFVDEYQDINPLQEQILKRLSQNSFFVGDIKQSIYAFRMCDPKIFGEKYRLYKTEGTGEVIELNRNFRSEKGILDFTNRVFENVMTLECGGADYKNTAKFELNSEINDGENIGKDSVKTYAIIGSTEKERAREEIYSVLTHKNSESIDLNNAEINLTVEIITDIIKNEKAKLSDICVLLRSRGEFAVRLKEKLDEYNIPSFLKSGKNIFDCSEVSVFISILKFIENPLDDISLSAALISPLGGFNLDELTQIRLKKLDAKFFHEAFFYLYGEYKKGDKTPLNTKIAEFVQKTEKYRNLCFSHNAVEIADKIIADNDYFKYVFAKDGGDIKARELSAFLDLLDSTPFNVTLSGFIDYLKQGEIEININPQSDAVKIMTVHAAKGLEFDYVIMPKLCKRFNAEDLRFQLLTDKELGFSLRPAAVFGSDAPDNKHHENILSRKKHSMIEEEMRLLYVALTRAKKQLHLIAGFKKQDNLYKEASEFNSFFDFIRTEFNKAVRILDARDCFAGNEPTHETQIISAPPNMSAVEKIKETLNYKYPHAPEVIKTSVTAILNESKVNLDSSMPPQVYAEGGENDDRASERGSKFHEAMEKIDFNLDFETQYQEYLKDFSQDSELLDYNQIKNAAEILRAYINKREIKKEVPFIATVKNGENNVLVQGVIDLLILNDDGTLEIIDYKTGKAGESSRKQYFKQLKLYKTAAETILKRAVVKTAIYSFEHKTFFEC